MVKFIIDKQEIEVDDNATILEAATALGIEIPTLCYLDSCKNGGSCMACAVLNLKTNRLVPSCIAKCRDNLEVDSSSDAVLDFRKKVTQLLLSEHRGECKAPCELACPKNLPISKILYHIASGNIEEAKSLLTESCADCDRRCLKACRRGRVDESISIDKIFDSIYTSVNSIEQKHPKRYNHMMGAVSKEELECFVASRFFCSSQEEAARCLGCGCHANGECKLQDLATITAAKQRHYTAQNRSFKRKLFGEVCYEETKCVKCGNCISIAQKHKKESIVFVERGRDLHVDSPIGVEDSEIFCGIEAECVKSCPTGALFWHKGGVR